MLRRRWQGGPHKKITQMKPETVEFELAKLPQILLCVIGGPILAAAPGIILGIAAKALSTMIFS